MSIQDNIFWTDPKRERTVAGCEIEKCCQAAGGRVGSTVKDSYNLSLSSSSSSKRIKKSEPYFEVKAIENQAVD